MYMHMYLVKKIREPSLRLGGSPIRDRNLVKLEAKADLLRALPQEIQT